MDMLSLLVWVPVLCDTSPARLWPSRGPFSLDAGVPPEGEIT
jgi:hypothetical protein